MGGGVLLWLPEIGQVELNHIARAIYIARAEKSDDGEASVQTSASRALDALLSRRTEAKKRLGTDDPLLLATTLHENLEAKEREEAVKKLDGVRLMPLDKYIVRSTSGDRNGFPQMIKFWRSPEGPFAKLPTTEWQAMFDKVAA
jgi:hypothetical protein